MNYLFFPPYHSLTWLGFIRYKMGLVFTKSEVPKHFFVQIHLNTAGDVSPFFLFVVAEQIKACTVYNFNQHYHLNQNYGF